MLPTDSAVGPSSYPFRGISDLLMSIDLYEVRPHKVYRKVNLISHALPFGRLWYLDAAAAFGYAKFYSRSHDAVIGCETSHTLLRNPVWRTKAHRREAHRRLIQSRRLWGGLRKRAFFYGQNEGFCVEMRFGSKLRALTRCGEAVF